MAASPALRSRTPDAGWLRSTIRTASRTISAAAIREGVQHVLLRPRWVARKLAEHAMTIAYAKLYLRACDRVGARPSCFGPVWIDNKGSMALGDEITLGGNLGSVSLTSAPGGTLAIGDRVTIQHGSWISAAREVVIGSDVTIGPYGVIADAEADTPNRREDATPIAIGSGVRLAARVVVRPGARIGDGAVIGAGSVVEGTIPPRALASGVPARVIGVRGPDTPDVESDVGLASERRPRFAEQEMTDACC